MVRQGLGRAEEQGWTPEHVAAYFVEQLQERELGDQSRTVLSRYFSQLDDPVYEGVVAGQDDLAAYLLEDDAEPDWERLEQSLAAFVTEYYDCFNETGWAEPQQEVLVKKQITEMETPPVCERCQAEIPEDSRERGYKEMETVYTLDPVDGHGADPWLTRVHAVYCPEDDHPESHIVQPYDAAAASRHLAALTESNDPQAATILRKAADRGDLEKTEAFAATMLINGGAAWVDEIVEELSERRGQEDAVQTIEQARRTVDPAADR